MDKILVTNYKPDYTNDIMTISVQINTLGINAQVSITMDEFNNAIAGAGGADRVKLVVLNTLIDSLMALRPDTTTTTTTTTTKEA